VNLEEGGEEGEKKDKGKVTLSKDPPIEALKQEKKEILDQLQVAQKEKNEIWAKFEQNNAKIQEEKDQLLAEKTAVKEAVTKTLRYVSGLAQKKLKLTDMQVGKLVEAIQQLQAWIMELDLQAISSTPQEVCDQREEAVRNVVERIRALAS
jgi:phosphopantetheinyl transferase (holo-ACP synthase)